MAAALQDPVAISLDIRPRPQKPCLQNAKSEETRDINRNCIDRLAERSANKNSAVIRRIFW